jgi:hypothetical protein
MEGIARSPRSDMNSALRSPLHSFGSRIVTRLQHQHGLEVLSAVGDIVAFAAGADQAPLLRNQATGMVAMDFFPAGFIGKTGG